MKELPRTKKLEVAQYYILGHSYSDIEGEAGVSHGSVVNIIKELEVCVVSIYGNDVRKWYNYWGQVTSINEAIRGQSIEVDALSFIILHPTKPLMDDTNNNSIVLRLSYGSVDFLFTGDAEKEAEASILQSEQALQTDILKVGHHCSKTSTSAQFLDAVKPEVAVYMAGEGNRYGHPH